MKKILLLLVSIVMFSSCDKLTEGTVINKWYEPSSVSVVMMPVTTMCGKVPVTTMIPYTIYDSEDWCMKVEGENQDGEIIQKTFYITEQQYNDIKVGQFVNVENGCDEDQNNKKERR